MLTLSSDEAFLYGHSLFGDLLCYLHGYLVYLYIQIFVLSTLLS